MKNQFLSFIKTKSTHKFAITAFLLTALYLLQLVLFYGIGGRDDSYITYWSAYSLSEFGEIVNYNGDRVEQSSSLLQTLLLAFFHKISNAPIPLLGIIFSILCGITTALLAGKLAKDFGCTYYKWLPFIIMFVPYFSYWSSSGMETSLAALCIMFTLVTLRVFLNAPPTLRSYLLITIAVILYTLVRPESGLVLTLFILALLLMTLLTPGANNQRQRVIKIIFLLAVCITIFLILASWRYQYFGQIFPQPVYAKTDLGHISERLALGLRYLEYSLNLSTSLLVLLSIIALIATFKNKNPIATSFLRQALLFSATYLCFIAFSGGDWMEARRLLAPLMPVICLIALTQITSTKIFNFILPVLFVAMLVDAWQLSKKDSIGLSVTQAETYFSLAAQITPAKTNNTKFNFGKIEAFNYSHLRDMLTIPAMDELATTLISKQDKPIVITSRQMGMIPYYTAINHYKHVRFIDLRGLVTKDLGGCKFITDTKPKSSSGTLITTRYYLENQPQIITACAFPKADIVYDTGFINNIETTNTVLADAGYQPYYTQSSAVGNLFTQYIAVANSLAP